MHELADTLAAGLVTAADELAREFEARLADSSSLAFRVAYSVLRHRQDAEDVAQEAFDRATAVRRPARPRAVPRLGGPHDVAPRPGLQALADRRRAARGLRRAPARPRRWRVRGGRSKSPRGLWPAIDQLPPKLRLVVVLSAIEGQSVADVAVLLHAPEGTVKSRLFDARARLREMLTND